VSDPRAIGPTQAHHKHHKEAKPKMLFNISTSGLKIYDVATGTLRETFQLDKISYVTILPKDAKVFCFISLNDTVVPPVFKCHVFKSDTKACLITDALDRCFTLAFELQRAAIDARAASATARMASPVRPASVSRPAPSASFHQRQCQAHRPLYSC